jgi:hypothetical protein
VKIVDRLLVHLPTTFHYRVVLMKRNTSEIVASQDAMLNRLGCANDTELASKDIVAMTENSIDALNRWLDAQVNFSVVTVDYNQLMNGRVIPQLRRLERLFNRRLDLAAMAHCIEPDLYRTRLQPGLR